MDIAPQDGARAAILRHELVPVIEEPGRSRSAGHLVEPRQRIVSKARALRARGSHHTVLTLAAERSRATRSEVTGRALRAAPRASRGRLDESVRPPRPQKPAKTEK